MSLEEATLAGETLLEVYIKVDVRETFFGYEMDSSVPQCRIVVRDELPVPHILIT
jgi:hypothetical protein